MARKSTYEELEQRVKELQNEVAKHKRAEEKLRLFSQAVDSSVDGIAMGNLEDRIAYVNEEFARIFGYPRKELIGQEIAFIYAEDQRAKLEEALKATMEGGWAGELVGKRKDGGLFSVAISSSRVVDDKGKVIAQMASHQDITERKRAEKALRESEERYRLLVETMNDGLAVMDENMRLTFVNDRFCEMLGYVRPELIGRPGTDLHDEANQRILREQIAKRRRGEHDTYEIAFTRKDGQEVFTIISPRPIVDTEGHFKGSFAVVTDITEYKEAEEALRESEAKYRQLFATVSDAIMVFESDTKQFVDVNDAALRLYGYSKEEFLKLRHPAITAEPEKSVASIVKTLAGELTRIPLRYHKKKDGTVFPVEISASTFTLGNRRVLCGVIRDITDRKRVEEELRKSEHKYRTLLEHIPQKIFHKDRNSVYLSCNDNYARDLKIKPEEIKGKTDYEFFPKKLAKKYRADDSRIIASGKTEDIEEKYIQDGQEIWVHTAKTAIKDEKGNVTGILGIFWDITQRKQAEEALQESREKLAGIVESVTDAMIMVDKEFNVVWTNDIARGLFGPDLVGRKCYAAYRRRDTVCEPCIVQQCFDDPRIHEFETEITDNNETQRTFWCTASVAERDEDGRPKTVVEFLRDITQRKHAESEIKALKQQIEFILGATKTGLDIIDSDFNIRYIDPEWEKTYGDPAERKCYEYFMDESEPCPGCGITKAMETKTPIVTEEVLVKEANRPIQVTTIPFQNDEGEWLFAEVNVDIRERKRAEEALREREAALEARTTELEETNRALRVLLKRMDEDKRELEEKVSLNIKELVVPYAEKLKKSRLGAKQMTYLSILESNLNDIVSPFVYRLSSKYLGFTPTEIQVAPLVRDGKTTKEIAELLNSSDRTIECHRRNIRMKIGIKKEKANLRSFLLSM